MQFDIDSAPRWLREFDQALAIRPCIVVHGNIHDKVFLRAGQTDLAVGVADAIVGLLTQRQTVSLTWDPTGAVAISDPGRTAAILEQARRRLTVGQALPIAIDAAALPDWAESLESLTAFPAALVIRFASRITADPARPDPEAHAFFLRLFKLIHGAAERRKVDESGTPCFNPLVLMIDRVQDLPPWFLVGNARIREVALPLPDYDARLRAAEAGVRRLGDHAAQPEDVRRKTAVTIAEQTDGMPLRALDQIVNLARRYALGMDRVPEAVRRFRVGLPDNPWAQSYLRDRIKDANKLLCARIEGQQHAIRLAEAVLTRAHSGLSGAQTGRDRTKPRGVLFFAGPTGVGKTELARGITQLLFNDERACVRFDMSEFGSEHSEARLIGAPPGYVGYDAGGELVNAVRQRPFSVLLFDEIDKAHPSILDKFLQILDEGRLTDGRGDTAFFSECIIIFTSNLGIYRDTPTGKELVVKMDDDPVEVRAKVLAEIKRVFRSKLGRPELLNRIGDNIVVFDFISKPVAARIAAKMLDAVIARVRAELGITLVIAHEVRAKLLELVVAGREDGGRGVGNRVKSAFINPLAHALFHSAARRGQTVTVERMTAASDGCDMVLTCR